MSGKYTKDVSVNNTVHYCMFLYELSRICKSNNYKDIADVLYALNKMMHGVELFHEIELPRIWSCEHPVGSVMGRADYGDFFMFYQGCTIGENNDICPTIGKNVTMYANSCVIGNCKIGNNVLIGAGTFIFEEDVPNNSIVYGMTPNLVIRGRE